jgi:hypothetical protein
MDVSHLLPGNFNNKAAKARMKNYSGHRQSADADLRNICCNKSARSKTDCQDYAGLETDLVKR